MPEVGHAPTRSTPPPVDHAELRTRAAPEEAAPPAPSRPGGVLPLAGACLLFLLVVVSLQVSSRLRDALEAELAARLRISARLAAEALPRDGTGTFDPASDALRDRLERIREATSVSDIFLYDSEGALAGGTGSEVAVPRRLRLSRPDPGAGADPANRDAEWDPAGGLSLVLPLPAETGAGAVLARIGREEQGGLAAVDFFFQVAKTLAAVAIVAGALILLRWVTRGPSIGPGSVIAGSDVDVVLGTMKEVMTTLKDSETEYRDRATAAEADALRHRVTNDLVLASISSGIVVFDLSGRITQFNRAAEIVFAVERRRALGRSVADVFGPDDRVTALAEDVLARGRTASRVEYARPGPDGEPRWIGTSSSVVHDGDGRPLGGILLITDLTETKRLRDQAGLRDRLSAVGEMSAGIAHEIKNSLHSLNGFANLLREDFGADDPPLAATGILSEVESLQSLVHGILEFSKPSQLLKEPTALNGLVRETKAATAAAADGSRVAIELDLEEGLPEALVDPGAARRVFLNLALNAIEAMEEGGTLTISTRSAELPGEGGREGGGGRPAVRVSFRDTGPGIPESDRTRIFTPFWSTKRDGNGLGLALAHKTVTDHGGRLHLRSRVGVGSEFVIHLPVEG